MFNNRQELFWVKYIEKLEDVYPLDFFGLRNGELPTDGMFYFVERRWFNKSWMPVKWGASEVYKVVNGQWVRGKLVKPDKKQKDGI